MSPTIYKTVKVIINDIDNVSVDNIESLSSSENVSITKSEIKQKAKSEINRKFIIGNIYKLTDVRKNKYFVPRIFKCIKFIYSIKETPVNIVIMKALDNNTAQKFSLNQTDCIKYHIKYEPGLEVYSMLLNWKDITNKYNK